MRHDDRLSLAPAWVDVRAFQAAADRVRGMRAPRALPYAYAALALWSGPPLPADSYAEWAHAAVDQLRHRYLSLLDLIVKDATARGSVQEAVAALTIAVDENPDDAPRYRALIDKLRTAY